GLIRGIGLWQATALAVAGSLGKGKARRRKNWTRLLTCDLLPVYKGNSHPEEEYGTQERETRVCRGHPRLHRDALADGQPRDHQSLRRRAPPPRPQGDAAVDAGPGGGPRTHPPVRSRRRASVG